MKMIVCSGVEQKWSELLQETRVFADQMKIQASNQEVLEALLAKELAWIEQCVQELKSTVTVELVVAAADQALAAFQVSKPC